MGEKTEEPSPKKLRDARKKGQVANSKDLTTAALFLASFSVLLAVGPSLSESLKEYLHEYLTYAVKNPDRSSNSFAYPFLTLL